MRAEHHVPLRVSYALDAEGSPDPSTRIIKRGTRNSVYFIFFLFFFKSAYAQGFESLSRRIAVHCEANRSGWKGETFHDIRVKLYYDPEKAVTVIGKRKPKAPPAATNTNSRLPGIKSMAPGPIN